MGRSGNRAERRDVKRKCAELGIARLNAVERLAGTRYNHWTILSVRRLEKTNYLAEAECVCGVRRTHYLHTLRSGRSKSCGCRAHENTKRFPFLGDMVTAVQIAGWAGCHVVTVRNLLKSKSAEQIVESKNPTEYTRLKLSKTKKRGRPLKTLDGREISHEEFLRGLVQHQAIKDAS